MVGLNRFLGLAVLSVAMVAPALSEEPYQPWIKKGQILAPGFAGEKSNRLLSAPCVVKLENGRLRMYFWASGDRHSPQVRQHGGQFPAGENLRGVGQTGMSGLHGRFSQRCKVSWRRTVLHASDSHYLGRAEKASEFGPSSRMLGPTSRKALRRTLTIAAADDPVR